tara:strand:+ start:55 stop:729 length:675 start_codon:yes stop_codon:yes gene_type:complete
MTYKILVVDDDQSIREALERGLQLEGFMVSSASSGDMAIQEVEENLPNILILDINMPGISGIQVIKYLRGTNIDIPICVLSARDEVSDRVSGLEAGADDYLVKPFALDELVARIRALLRRNKVAVTKTINLGSLRVDPQQRQALYCDKVLDLTKKEFDLLYVLSNNPNIVVSRYQLLEQIWGYDFEVDTNVVDVFVGYLRRKMEQDGNPRMIDTVRGVGFILRS